MSRLSERDYLGVLEVVRLAATGTHADPMPHEALLAVRRLIPNAEWVTFFEGPVADRRSRRLFTLAPDVPKEIQDASDAFRYQYPLRPTRETLGQGRRISDVMDRRTFHRLDLYAHVSQPLHIEHSLDVWLRPPHMPMLGWCLDAPDREFSDRDRDVLELLGRELAALMSAAWQRRVSTRGSNLTARERSILLLIAEGRSNRQIAALLDISQFTVRTHLEHAFVRLGVQTRAAAVAAAFI